VPNGSYTSGDHSQIDPNALQASSFAVSQGATATFAAGNCVHLTPGFRANGIGASVSTTFHAWVDLAPTPISVSPASPPANPPLTQTFTWTVSSPAGQSNLSHVFALFNTVSSSTANACYIHYDASTNRVYLANDASTAWLGGFAPSGTGSINNSQCTIAGTNSSPNPTGSGTQLGLTLNVTFNAASFPGTKNEYLYALDGTGLNTGWQQMGTWLVPAPPAPDFTVTAVPDTFNTLTGVYTNLNFTLTITPLNGLQEGVQLTMPNLMPGCGSGVFNPMNVYAPAWTSSGTMLCQENVPGDIWGKVRAVGLTTGKVHEVLLRLHVTQNPQYHLRVSSSPYNAGYNTPNDNWYNPGTPVTITTLPFDGYSFTGFSGVDSSSGLNGYVTMNSDRNVVANYVVASQVAAPSFSVPSGAYSAPQTVTITTTTGGASIRYTLDGSSPSSTNGTLYTAPVSVASTMTIRAIAYKSGMTDSPISAATYTITGAVAAPGFNPSAGTYSTTQTVTITSTTSGASIRYTLNGTTPTSSTGTLYSAPVSVTSTTTIKAIAYKSGMSDSAVTSSTYTITLGVVAPPSFSPTAGTYSSGQNVALTSTTSGATIRYTTDGSTPTSSTGTIYSGTISVSSNTTIKAIAYKSGMTDSPVTTAAYVIQANTSREYIRVGGRVIAIENK
jgi:hypothetical protein